MGLFQLSHSYLTISVDDGHPTDLKTAELLKKNGLKATFYVPATNPEQPVMPKNDLKTLSNDFEIGAHTFSHLPLLSMSYEKAREEIYKGKQWVEDLTGKKALSFCYPQGKFRPSIVELAKQAGFAGARTCMFNLNSFPQNPFLWGVSTHAYPHSALTQVRHALLERNFRGLVNFFVIHRMYQDWSEHFLRAVRHVEQHGGVAHLFFHSWEIDARGEWQKLARLFETLAQNPTLQRVTNGELFTQWPVLSQTTASL